MSARSEHLVRSGQGTPGTGIGSSPRRATQSPSPGGFVSRFLRGPVAALSAQFLSAGGSLVVQVLAARELGASEYGTFAIVYGVLVVLVAVLNGWVGDSLTVLDRFDTDIRAALTTSVAILLVGGGLLCAAVALLVGAGGVGTGISVGAMAVTSLLAELCRRLFMIRQEFWRLSFNNVSLVAGTLGALALHSLLGGELSSAAFALALSLGSAGSVLVAAAQLPWREMRPGRLRWGAMTHVARFAVWRAVQIGIRPAVLVVVRFIVAATAGRAAVAALEVARLIQAPAQTFVQGVGSFLLPAFAAEARNDVPLTAAGRRRMRTMLVAVVGATGVVAAVPLTAPELFERILTGGDFEVPMSAILGWAAFSIAFAWGLPAANYAAAHQRSFDVFRARAVDAVVAVVAVAGLALAGHSDLAAFGMAFGSAVGAVLLTRIRRQIDRGRRAEGVRDGAHDET